MKRILVVCPVLLLTLFGYWPRWFNSERASAHGATRGGESGSFRPGELIVKLKPGFGPAPGAADGECLSRVSAVAALAGIQERPGQVKRLIGLPASGRLASLAAAHGLDRTFVLKFPDDEDLGAAIQKLEASGTVEYAEPNYRIKLGGLTPNDPLFPQQWGLFNRGYPVNGFPGTIGADIKATDAWAITTGNPNVLVAVVDTGLDINHPDIAANVWTNPGEVPGSGVDGDHNGYIDDVNGFNTGDNNNDVSDIVGHGTEVAGIIAAVLNNNIGVSGIAQCKIVPVRFFTKTGPGIYDVEGTVAAAAAAIVYSVVIGANIINASWTTLLQGAGVPNNQARALRDAVSMSRDAGALLVCIAGNDGFDNDVSPIYPGHWEMENQIVVAASDDEDQIWTAPGSVFPVTSGFGPASVHLAAPGVGIQVIQAEGTCQLCNSSSDQTTWYSTMFGTSASAGFVSGVAALVKSVYPEADAAALKARILAGVDIVPDLAPYVITSGRLNAYGALTASLSVTPPALTKVRYKAKSGVLILNGQGIQQHAFAIVGGMFYPTTSNSSNPGQVAAAIPNSAFPAGVTVPIQLINPDGGESAVVNLTR